MLELINVTVRFRIDENTVVSGIEGINLNVSAGELLVVLGPNGSGKSTLARTMNGLIVPRSGTVSVDGMSTSEDLLLQEVRRRVQMVFQNPDAQLVSVSVEDELAFGLENLALDPEIIQQRIEEALDIFNLSELKHAEPHFLSGGQKQKLAIAAAFAMRPSYLVLDEPTSMLDDRGCKEFWAAMDTVRKNTGAGIVLISHDVLDVLHADRVLVLIEGRIAFLGTVEHFLFVLPKLKDNGLEIPVQLEIAANRGLGIELKDAADPEAYAELLGRPGPARWVKP